MMDQEVFKQKAAKAALDYVEENTVIGVGTGSTVNYFIEYLGRIKHKIEGAVPSSHITETRLKSVGIPTFDLNAIAELKTYIDGADAYNAYCQLIKGGGGALTREKILAAASQQFVCMVDVTKATAVFGEFPIPIEVIPMARSFVAREVVKLGGDPVYRQNFVTDNGNIILDVYNWVIEEPIKIERALNNITGVVCNGLFADRRADIVLVGSEQGVEILKSNN